ncbi:MAG: hypothetical protein JNL01_16855 [Bdellovibrionales bacterium]|nr:hypothetical protein [Bdellovibrionales bacterium]
MASNLLAVLVLALMAFSSYGQTPAVVKGIDQKGTCEFKMANTPSPKESGYPYVLREWTSWMESGRDVTVDECIRTTLENRRKDPSFQFDDKVMYRFKVGRKVVAKGAFYNR